MKSNSSKLVVYVQPVTQTLYLPWDGEWEYQLNIVKNYQNNINKIQIQALESTLYLLSTNRTYCHDTSIITQ